VTRPVRRAVRRLRDFNAEQVALRRQWLLRHGSALRSERR
jgi:hypothetical protein